MAGEGRGLRGFGVDVGLLGCGGGYGFFVSWGIVLGGNLLAVGRVGRCGGLTGGAVRCGWRFGREAAAVRWCSGAELGVEVEDRAVFLGVAEDLVRSLFGFFLLSVCGGILCLGVGVDKGILIVVCGRRSVSNVPS